MRHLTTFVIGLTLVAVSNAGAAGSCGNDLLAGAYGLRVSGMVKTPLAVGIAGAGLNDAITARMKAGTPGSNAASGYSRLMLDGAGGVYGSSAASILGIWSQGPVVGQYAVDEDCAIALTLTDAAGGVQHFNGVLTRTGDSAAVLQTDAGTGVSGELKRSALFCDGTAVPGRLKLPTSGAVGGAGPFNSVGALEIDENGNVSAVETRFSDGKATHVSSTGPLAVNADCSVSLRLTSTDGSVVAFEGVLVGAGRELMLVRTDAGVIVGGEAVAQ